MKVYGSKKWICRSLKQNFLFIALLPFSSSKTASPTMSGLLRFSYSQWLNAQWLLRSSWFYFVKKVFGCPATNRVREIANKNFSCHNQKVRCCIAILTFATSLIGTEPKVRDFSAKLCCSALASAGSLKKV